MSKWTVNFLDDTSLVDQVRVSSVWIPEHLGLLLR